jgi:DNA-binding transcriptional MerR regulator
MDKIRISELSKRSGFSKRTIRFFIQEQLIRPPSGRGSGSFYDEEHLRDLSEIKMLRDKGLKLSKIKELLKSHKPEIWQKYILMPGFEIHVESEFAKHFKYNIPHLIHLFSDAWFKDDDV